MLSKTEKSLLVSGKTILGAEWVHGVGPEGGRINAGYRKWHAARRLVARGLARLRSTSRTVANGTTSNCITIEIEREGE